MMLSSSSFPVRHSVLKEVHWTSASAIGRAKLGTVELVGADFEAVRNELPSINDLLIKFCT